MVPPRGQNVTRCIVMMIKMSRYKHGPYEKKLCEVRCFR